MDKHALFLYGDYRTFDWTHLWWANKLPENIDVYISTYNKSFEERISEVQYNHNQKEWNVVNLKEPPTPKGVFPAYSTHSINHIIDGINDDIFYSIFGKRLRNVFIKEVDINSFIFKEPIGSTKYIIQHWKRCLSMLKEDNYKNLFILRMDAIPLREEMGKGYDIFTFNDKLYPDMFNLEDNTLYSSSHPTMNDWKFAADLQFCGTFKTMKKWIDYLDEHKHHAPHEGIARATGELVLSKELNHKEYYRYRSELIRRGIVPYIADCWEKDFNPFTDKEKKFEILKLKLEKINHTIRY